MKPFGQWLNDFKPAKEVEDTVEIVLENAPTFNSQYANAPSAQMVVLCRCHRGGKPLNSHPFGMEPNQVTEDHHFLCDDCWRS